MAGAFQLGSYQASAFQLDVGPVVSYTSQLNFPSRVYLSAGSAFALSQFPGWSFANSTGGYDLDGTTLFAANVPRVTSAGLLLEAAATNLIYPSQNAYGTSPWTVNGGFASATASAATAPDGSTTAFLLTDNSANTNHYIQQTYVFSVGTTYTFSTFAKNQPGNTTFLYLGAYDGTNDYAMSFNPATGAIGTNRNNNLVSYGSVAVGNGWYRYWISFTAANNSSQPYNLQLGYLQNTAFSSQVYSGTGTGCYLWGTQFEAALSASSYIPTTSAAATRTADIVSLTY